MTNKKYLDLLGKMKTKKVSLNIEEKTLELVDDLAKLTESNRTVIFSTVIEQGIYPFFQFLERGWTNLKKEGKGDSKTIDGLQAKLVLLKKKWKI